MYPVDAPASSEPPLPAETPHHHGPPAAVPTTSAMYCHGIRPSASCSHVSERLTVGDDARSLPIERPSRKHLQRGSRGKRRNCTGRAEQVQGLGGRHGRKGPWTRKYHSTSGGGGRRLWLQIDGVAAVCGGAVAGQSNPSFARESFPGTGTEAVCN
jgi:hypothetical protein